MKEIEELKLLSTDFYRFRREFEFNDIKVKRDYGDEYFVNLIKELEWNEDDIPRLKFWYCMKFFVEKIVNLTTNINNKIDTTMSQPFSANQKNENLTKIISECITLYFDFSKLGTQFERSPLLNIESLDNPIFSKLPMFIPTAKFSGTALVNDMYNYYVKLSNIDFSCFLNETRTLSKGNVLAFACDTVSVELLGLIDLFMKSYPKYISEKDVARIIKKMEKGIEETIVVRRGRPKKQEKELTLKEIWNDEKYSYDNMIGMLMIPRAIFDNEKGFVIKEENKYVWKNEPFGCHVKYIQGFLFFCHKNDFIDLHQFSRREIQGFFEKTFHLKVNEKDMFSENILKVGNNYYSDFWL